MRNFLIINLETFINNNMKRFRFDKPLIEAEVNPHRKDVLWVKVIDGKVSIYDTDATGEWVKITE